MSVRSLLISYLKQQRELGFDEIIFSPDFEVNRLFRASASTSPEKKSVAKEVKSTQTGTLKVPLPKKSKSTQNPFEKLSKMKPVQDLEIPKATSPQNLHSKRDLLKNLYFDVLKCSECGLSECRKKVIFGSGSVEGRVMIVGYCPGVEDEKAGLPFKGETEELFLNMLKAMKLDRTKDVFVTHVMKCRIPEGKAAQPEQIQNCRLILDRQLDIIKPDAVLVFGEDAANAMMGERGSIEVFRKADTAYKGIPAVFTYSVDLLHRDKNLKPGAWQDLKRLMAILNRNV
ncbi:MAG: uracil-DNA glycosylase [Chitinispirillaceae bacterium]